MRDSTPAPIHAVSDASEHARDLDGVVGNIRRMDQTEPGCGGCCQGGQADEQIDADGSLRINVEDCD
jgi:hypothetical protein